MFCSHDKLMLVRGNEGQIVYCHVTNMRRVLVPWALSAGSDDELVESPVNV